MKKIILIFLIILTTNAYSQFKDNMLKYFNTNGIKQIIERKYNIKDSVATKLAVQTNEFDIKGKLVKISLPPGEPFSKITFTYDVIGNLSREKYYKSDLLTNYSIYEYENNKLQNVVNKDRNDDVISNVIYQYTQDDKISVIKNEEFKYSSEYLYSGKNCYKIKLSNTSKIIKIIDMDYDKNGNVINETGSFMYSGDKNSKIYSYYKKSYKYDEKNRLIEMDWDNNGVNYDTYKYYYENGNLIKWERTDAFGKLNYRVEYEIVKY
jgi:hypothetical protein